jgi:hypothetical protein
MRVEFPVAPDVEAAPLIGAHRFAWERLLDEIFADAFAHQVTLLRIEIAHPDVQEMARLRADGASGASEENIAIVTQDLADRNADRVYRVSRGGVLMSGYSAGKTILARAYTLDAVAAGLRARIAAMRGSMPAQDRAFQHLQAGFTRTGKGRAFYHLEVTGRDSSR